MNSQLLILCIVLTKGLVTSSSDSPEYCNPSIRDKYCRESYGGDFHTGCKYCGIGPACPRGSSPSGRGIHDIDLQKEILDRHNIYRNQVKTRHLPAWPSSDCLQMLRWDNDLAEVAQIWADQCANVIYAHNDMYPKIFHERGMDRTTKNFHGPPGVGQNVAWALTKDVNFSKIIDDLWYKDINNFQPGYINEFNVDDSDGSLMTQIIWGRTTHVGCGWVQFPMGSHVDSLYPEGEYENFFVCNYGVGGNVPGEPVYDCLNRNEDGEEPLLLPTLPSTSLEIQFGERYPTSSPEIQAEIQGCFDAISCVKEGRRNCLDLANNCMREMEKELLIFVAPKDQIRVFECRIEYVLCSVELSPGFEMCNEYYEFCKVNRLTSPTSTDVLISSKDVDLTTIRPQTTLANRALTPSSRLSKRPLTSKIDISFYNATGRTSYKLAICLEGSRCNGEHNQTCFSLQSECNQGLDLTPVPNPVRKKLSECAIDDILCHLDGAIPFLFCQRKYEICADIVIPKGMKISALPSVMNDSGSSHGSNSHLEPFLFLLGLTEVANDLKGVAPTENVLTNVTNNVLGALDSAFGGIEILPLDTNINTLLGDNETLPIFQDIVVIIRNNATDNSTEYSVSGQGPIDVIDNYPDLTNATVIFSTSNIKIGSEEHSSIRDPLVDKIKEKIRESLSEIATECNSHICFEGIEESLHNPFPGLEDVMAFTSPGELQLKIAVCLQGIRCIRDKTCLKAQKKCIGKDNVVNYVKDDRIRISECVLEAHVCRMENGAGDERCDLTFIQCLNPIFDILNSKKYQFQFLDPEYENFTSLSDVLKSFPTDIIPKEGDQFLFFSNEGTKDPQELIRDVTSNITEMILNSDRKKPVQLIPLSYPTWEPDLRVINSSEPGVISLLNSNPNFSFKTPNGTTALIIDPKDGTLEMLEKTISSILENPISQDAMKDVISNITRLFESSPGDVMELRPIDVFSSPQDEFVQGDVIILKKNDGQIALISSSPQLSFNSSSPIMSLESQDLVPEEIQAIVENSIISNRIKSPSNKKKPNKNQMIHEVVSQIMGLVGNEDSGTIQLRPVNGEESLCSRCVSVIKENDTEDRVFQIISQSPEIMTFITPTNSTISVDLEALPRNKIPNEITNMLNFIAQEGHDPRETVKSSSHLLRDIAQQISSGIRPEDNLVRIKPINGPKKDVNNIIMKNSPQKGVIEVISQDKETQFSTPDNLIVEIDVKDLEDKGKMTNRIEDTLVSLLNTNKEIPQIKEPSKLSKIEMNEIINELATDISLLSRDTQDVIVIKPQNIDPSDGTSNTNVEREVETKIIKLKLKSPFVKFITPENSTLAIDVSNLNREDVIRRVEDTLRSILKERDSKTNSMSLLLDNGFTNEIIQNLTSSALLELNGQIGGDFDILPLSDSQDLYDLLKDNDTLKFKVDFTVEGQGNPNEEPLVIISNTPVQKVGNDFDFNTEGPGTISVDSLSDIGRHPAVRNQLLHSFDQMEGLSEGDEELNHVVDDIMNLINGDEEITLEPQLVSGSPVKEDGSGSGKKKKIKIPSSLKGNQRFKLPNTPINIKLKNDNPKKKIKDVLNQISEVMSSVEKKRKMQIQIKDAAAQIVERLPTELKDVGVILIPKNVESVQSLDSGHKKIYLFAIPTQYPSTSLENEKEIYINLSNEEPQDDSKDSLLNVLVSKLREEANNQKTDDGDGQNFILDLPIFGISVSEISDAQKNKNILPAPGKTNVLSIPQFGLNVTVDNETDFLNVLNEGKKGSDPLGNGSDLTKDGVQGQIDQDISSLFFDEVNTESIFDFDDLPGITGFIEETPREDGSDEYIPSSEGYFLEKEFTTTTEYSPLTGSSINADYPLLKENPSPSTLFSDQAAYDDFSSQDSYDLYYDDISDDGQDDYFSFSLNGAKPTLETLDEVQDSPKDHEFKIGFEPLEVHQGTDPVLESNLDKIEGGNKFVQVKKDETILEVLNEEDESSNEDNLFSSISNLGSNLPLIINSGLSSFNLDDEIILPDDKYNQYPLTNDESENEGPPYHINSELPSTNLPIGSNFNPHNSSSQFPPTEHSDDDQSQSSSGSPHLDALVPSSNLPSGSDSITNNIPNHFPTQLNTGHDSSPIAHNADKNSNKLTNNSQGLPTEDAVTTTPTNEKNVHTSHHTLPIVSSDFVNPAPTLPIFSANEDHGDNPVPPIPDEPSPTLPLILKTPNIQEEALDPVITSLPDVDKYLTDDVISSISDGNGVLPPSNPELASPSNLPIIIDDTVSNEASSDIKDSLPVVNGDSFIPSSDSIPTTSPHPYSNIVGGVRNVILGILATVMANNLSKFRESTLGFDRINDPDIRRKIQENGIVFDENNINFTIPVAPHTNFQVDSLKEDLQSAIKSALSPAEELPELNISVEDQTNKGSLSIGAMDSSALSPDWNPNQENLQSNVGQRPKFILDRFKFDENAYSFSGGYPEVAEPIRQGGNTTPQNNAEEINKDEGYDINEFNDWESLRIPSDNTPQKEPSIVSNVGEEWNIISEIKKNQDASPPDQDQFKIPTAQNIDSEEWNKELLGGPTSQNEDDGSEDPKIHIAQDIIGPGGWNTKLLQGSSTSSNAEDGVEIPEFSAAQDIGPGGWNTKLLQGSSTSSNAEDGVEIPELSAAQDIGPGGWNTKLHQGTISSNVEGGAEIPEFNTDSSPIQDSSIPKFIQHSINKESKPIDESSIDKSEGHEDFLDTIHDQSTTTSPPKIDESLSKSNTNEGKEFQTSSENSSEVSPPFSNTKDIISPESGSSVIEGESDWKPLDEDDNWIQKVDEGPARKSISEKINVRISTARPNLASSSSRTVTRSTSKPKPSFKPVRTSSRPSIISNEVEDDERSNYIEDDTTLPPTLFEPVETVYSDVEYIPDNKIIDYTDDDKILFERGLNFLSGGASSANIVEASVVEDLNYARSIRNSRGMGIGTIASITIGILVLFGFALLVFFAVARRRRRYLDDVGGLYGIDTPSQSRTTFTDSPMGTMATPSEIRPSLPDEPPGPEPVLQLDGHQTIISSYNEFLNSGEPLDTPPTLRTKNLSDSSEYLFARQIS